MNHYKTAFLFNGIGSKPEKLLVHLPAALMERYLTARDEAFSRLGLHTDLERNTPFDRRVAEWLISLLCDRVVFDHYIQQGIVPDIGAGYSSGIVSISACFGSVPDTFAHHIILMNRATMQNLANAGMDLDMGVVIGFGYEDAQQLLFPRFSREELVIGSGNSVFCTMISGRAEAVRRALELMLAEGAIKAIPFGTGIAYHHPILANYAREYVDFCGSIPYRDPDYPILSAFDNRILTSGQEIMLENQRNVMTPIRWDLALRKLEELGVTAFYDVSANGAVKKFSRLRSRKCKIHSLQDV
ncbi:ACP S-malonyltransferase [Ruminococcus champanellensis]|uniref:ACP S-malonyltransferase n=2 Tax=Ruminococcus champanellensis TaxID=1161942 RepID=UPI002E7A8295|nr:ACP S-malonyltransferase [Ruminococcus champanellensis]MED9891383.1 ACP S-malonyltransferase [Ruminococcus champanellensis]